MVQPNFAELARTRVERIVAELVEQARSRIAQVVESRAMTAEATVRKMSDDLIAESEKAMNSRSLSSIEDFNKRVSAIFQEKLNELSRNLDVSSEAYKHKLESELGIAKRTQVVPGTQVRPESKGMEKPSRTCPSCHAALRSDSVFCPMCGAKVEDKESRTAEESTHGFRLHFRRKKTEQV